MNIEIPKERQIKNIGPRPHNLPYCQLCEITSSSEGKSQLGVLMLKPGCFSVYGRTSIQDYAEELISSWNLDVVSTSCVPLSREQIHRIYPSIFGANTAAATDRLVDLRVLLESYLSDCVFTYLVSGEDTQRKLVTIKGIVRQGVERVGNWDVHNRVHVPDKEELSQDVDILFNHPNCVVCSRHQNE